MARSAATGSRWRLAIIAVAGFLVYLNGVFTPFLFDDMPAVVDNQSIRHATDIWDVLLPPPNLPVSARPVVNLSFALNYAVGGLNVSGYHLWNIAIHVLCAVVLFGLIRRTLELPGIPAALNRRASDIAFAAALIWTLHPLNTEVIDYVTQRSESMMALFYLLTLYASVRGTRPWLLVAVGSCLLGIACKESMATAPVIVVLFDRLFVFSSFRDAWRARARFYAALASSWMLLVLLSMESHSRLSAAFTGVTPWTYLLNQAPILTRYLRLAVWPHPLVLLYGWPRDVTLQEVLPSALFIVALLTLTFVGLRFRPRLAFLGLCCWLTLAPTSTIIPMVTEVGAERRMYLPMAALSVMGVIAAVTLWDAIKERVPAVARTPRFAAGAAALLLAAISAALASATIARNREYATPVTMAQTIVDRYPTPIAHQMLGTTLLDAGRREEAMSELRQALPTAPRARYFLGVELLKDRKTDEAIAQLQTFVREQPPYLADVVDARGHLGATFVAEERWPEAIEQFRAILQVVPGLPLAEHFLADSLFQNGEWAESIGPYRAYLAAEPNDAGALNNLGVALASGGELDEAIEIFRRALVIDSNDTPAARNLANALSARAGEKR